MFLEGVLKPVRSEWTAPVVIALKKHGSVRFSVNYRTLNTVTKRDIETIPRAKELSDLFSEGEVFSSLNAERSYLKFETRNEDRDKTAFTSDIGHYHFEWMLF